MRAAERAGAKGAHEHAKRPAGRDDNPAAVVALGAGQHDVGDHAVAEEHQQQGANEFSEIGTHG